MNKNLKIIILTLFLLISGIIFWPSNNADAAAAWGSLDTNAGSINNNGNCNYLSGWAWDPDAPNTPITVAVWHNGAPWDAFVANAFRADLPGAGIGNGYHAFDFPIPLAWKDGGAHSINLFAMDTSGVGSYDLVHSPVVALVCAPPPPTVDLLVNGGNGPVSVAYNGSVTLTWTSVNANSGCLLNPEVSPGGNVGQSGSRTPTNITSTTTWTITCQGMASQVSDAVTVNVGPYVDLLANGSNGPVFVNYNTSATLSWTSINASSCSLFVNGSPTGWTGTSQPSVNTGNITTTPVLYRVDCSNAYGNISDTVQINLNVQPTCTNATPDGDWVSVATTTGSRTTTANGVTNASSVLFAVWDAPGGQDDIIWYPGTQSGGTWTVNIPYSAHTGAGGVAVHVYMSNGSYNNIWCDEASYNRLTTGTINVNSNQPTSWTITCTLTSPACPDITSGPNLTTGTYADKPQSSWTIIPANIPGYDVTVTPSNTQTFP